MNTFGSLFRLTTFGESHGPAMGAVVDGCPAGVPLEPAGIQRALDRRRQGQSTLVSPRQEPDQVEVLSGLFEGKTLGTPLAAMVRNIDARPEDYPRDRVRAGHADAVWRARFEHVDHRGGGRTSGRETLSRVIGGAIAEALLQRDLPEVQTIAWVGQVGGISAPALAPTSRAAVDSHPVRCPDEATARTMSERIQRARDLGDSLGGAIDLRVMGLPIGLGEPIFGKLKALLAQAMASIGAVTGVTWGAPDVSAALEQSGREFHLGSAPYSGIQGGMANGEPVELRVWFKPPATLGDVARAGRHDPCILPRAVPVVEAMASLVIADLWLQLRSREHRP